MVRFLFLENLPLLSKLGRVIPRRVETSVCVCATVVFVADEEEVHLKSGGCECSLV